MWFQRKETIRLGPPSIDQASIEKLRKSQSLSTIKGGPNCTSYYFSTCCAAVHVSLYVQSGYKYIGHLDVVKKDGLRVVACGWWVCGQVVS